MANWLQKQPIQKAKRDPEKNMAINYLKYMKLELRHSLLQF